MIGLVNVAFALRRKLFEKKAVVVESVASK